MSAPLREQTRVWGGLSFSELTGLAGASLWAAPRPPFGRPSRRRLLGVSGYFPNLVGLFDLWEDPVGPSGVPDLESPSRQTVPTKYGADETGPG